MSKVVRPYVDIVLVIDFQPEAIYSNVISEMVEGRTARPRGNKDLTEDI
jgi:hypothetical protein